MIQIPKFVARTSESSHEGAGDRVGTAADLARFLGALVGGKLLPPDLTADMIETLGPARWRRRARGSARAAPGSG